MKRSKFTAKERAYLLSLPAVESVTKERIFYSKDFRKECMRRYNRGESPTRIFNDAGLYSSLIGYKRIERCIARWRDGEISKRSKGSNDVGDDLFVPSQGRMPSVYPESESGTEHAEDVAAMPDWERQHGGAAAAVPNAHRRTPQDVSGLMLVRYESRLRDLERQIKDLKARLDGMQERGVE